MEPKQAKQIQFMIFGSFVMLVVLLWIFIGLTPTTNTDPQAAIIAIVVSVASAAMCVFWSLTRLRPRGQVGDTPSLPEPTRFQTDVMVALAFAEMPALIGIFVGHLTGGLSSMPFVAVSLACFLVIVLPRLVEYWRLYENQI